jgi:DDE family transposase
VVAGFDGGAITSDAGALLLGATDRASGLVRRFAACFRDARSAERIEHAVATPAGQRVFGIALGYEDLIDHDRLRHDPVLAILAGKLEAGRAGCAPLAGKGTLDRLEHAPAGGPGRYHRIGHDAAAIETLSVDLVLDAHRSAPRRIVLDPDATGVPPHGHQEGRFFHGYYDAHCYLPLHIFPLHIFRGRHLPAAKLRRSDIDGSAGALEEVERIIRRIRARWPRVRIPLRADCGCAREPLMARRERNRVDSAFGLARDSRLVEGISIDLAWAEEEAVRTGQPARRFGDFRWSTLDSWPRRRRVIGKAEWTQGEANPRFVVPSLKPWECAARELHERVCCARGDTEKRAKECRLDLFAGRASAATMRANQLRLWFASMAYVLLCALRRIGLAHTRFAEATCGSLRLKPLKIGALVRRSVRRLKLAMASAHPYQAEFALAHARSTAAAPA